jgi:hypothetical protein
MKTETTETAAPIAAEEGMTKKPGAPRLSDRDSGRGKMRADGTRKFESERAYRNRIARHRIRVKGDPRKVKNWNLLLDFSGSMA